MLSEKTYDFEMCAANKIRIIMDTSELAPGEYSADIVAFARDEYQNDCFIDGVYPGFFFELSDVINGVNRIKWLHQYWGYTHLRDLKVE